MGTHQQVSNRGVAERGWGACGVYNQHVTSQTSQRGHASLVANRFRAAANTGGGAMPGQVPTDSGVGNARRTLSRNSTPPGYRRINDYDTTMLGGGRRSFEGP